MNLTGKVNDQTSDTLPIHVTIYCWEVYLAHAWKCNVSSLQIHGRVRDVWWKPSKSNSRYLLVKCSSVIASRKIFRLLESWGDQTGFLHAESAPTKNVLHRCCIFGKSYGLETNRRPGWSPKFGFVPKSDLRFIILATCSRINGVHC